mmetsp:Transcript_28912/g.93368  ORF Transcript_28912/g.93368 Transcript_28912/m.93368 type:complete len:247 (+) Transcript_28912:26-766(+)|eukprot:scaffold608_cov120-Isochrysis_galbana.AAC.2
MRRASRAAHAICEHTHTTHTHTGPGGTGRPPGLHCSHLQHTSQRRGARSTIAPAPAPVIRTAPKAPLRPSSTCVTHTPHARRSPRHLAHASTCMPADTPACPQFGDALGRHRHPSPSRSVFVERAVQLIEPLHEWVCGLLGCIHAGGAPRVVGEVPQLVAVLKLVGARLELRVELVRPLQQLVLVLEDGHAHSGVLTRGARYGDAAHQVPLALVARGIDGAHCHRIFRCPRTLQRVKVGARLLCLL